MRRCDVSQVQRQPRLLFDRASSVRQPRSRLACDQCRIRKLKCDDRRPCAPCSRRLEPCTESSPRRPRGNPSPTQATFPGSGIIELASSISSRSEPATAFSGQRTRSAAKQHPAANISPEVALLHGDTMTNPGALPMRPDAIKSRMMDTVTLTQGDFAPVNHENPSINLNQGREPYDNSLLAPVTQKLPDFTDLIAFDADTDMMDLFSQLPDLVSVMPSESSSV